MHAQPIIHSLIPFASARLRQSEVLHLCKPLNTELWLNNNDSKRGNVPRSPQPVVSAHHTAATRGYGAVRSRKTCQARRLLSLRLGFYTQRCRFASMKQSIVSSHLPLSGIHIQSINQSITSRTVFCRSILEPWRERRGCDFVIASVAPMNILEV